MLPPLSKLARMKQLMVRACLVDAVVWCGFERPVPVTGFDETSQNPTKPHLPACCLLERI
jgi:hypothetical protein